MKNTGTWVALFFVTATLLVGYVLHLAFADIFVYFRIPNAPVLGPRFPTSALAGMGLAVLIAVYAAFLNKRSRSYVEEFVTEFDKVAWPSWNETKTATITVIVTSILAAVVLGAFDLSFSWLTTHNLFLF